MLRKMEIEVTLPVQGHCDFEARFEPKTRDEPAGAPSTDILNLIKKTFEAKKRWPSKPQVLRQKMFMSTIIFDWTKRENSDVFTPQNPIIPHSSSVFDLIRVFQQTHWSCRKPALCFCTLSREEKRGNGRRFSFMDINPFTLEPQVSMHKGT